MELFALCAFPNALTKQVALRQLVRSPVSVPRATFGPPSWSDNILLFAGCEEFRSRSRFAFCPNVDIGVYVDNSWPPAAVQNLLGLVCIGVGIGACDGGPALMIAVFRPARAMHVLQASWVNCAIVMQGAWVKSYAACAFVGWRLFWTPADRRLAAVFETTISLFLLIADPLTGVIFTGYYFKLQVKHNCLTIPGTSTSALDS